MAISRSTSCSTGCQLRTTASPVSRSCIQSTQSRWKGEGRRKGIFELDRACVTNYAHCTIESACIGNVLEQKASFRISGTQPATFANRDVDLRCWGGGGGVKTHPVRNSAKWRKSVSPRCTNVATHSKVLGRCMLGYRASCRACIAQCFSPPPGKLRLFLSDGQIERLGGLELVHLLALQFLCSLPSNGTNEERLQVWAIGAAERHIDKAKLVMEKRGKTQSILRPSKTQRPA